MTTLQWPGSSDFTPMSGKFRLAPINQYSTSPYTGAGKSISLDTVWRADLTWNSRDLESGIDFQGFIEALEGAATPVALFDWWRPFPRALAGNVTGFSDGTLFDDGTGFEDGWSPAIVTAAAKGERRVHMSGLPVSQECFRRGDLFGINGYLYEVKAAAQSNASGESLVNVLPGLRAGVATGDAVTLWRPRVTMRLVPNDDILNRTFNIHDPFTLAFVEDIP